MAVGLSYWQMMRLIILPQALKITIPNIVNTYIGLFKDTTLVFIVGIFDFLMTIEAARIDPNWATPVTSADRLCLRRDLLFDLLLRHVALCAVRRSPARARATGAEGAAMAQRTAQAGAQARAAQDRRRRRDRSACTSGTAISTCCATSTCAVDQERAHRDLRAVGLRQVDHDPLHQPAGGAPAGPHHRRRHRAHQRPEEDRRGAPRRRHGVPALQPVSASHRAGELHAGADLGAQACPRSEAEEIAMHYLAARQDPRAGRQISRASCPAASSSASRSRARCA